MSTFKDFYLKLSSDIVDRLFNIISNDERCALGNISNGERLTIFDTHFERIQSNCAEPKCFIAFFDSHIHVIISRFTAFAFRRTACAIAGY